MLFQRDTLLSSACKTLRRANMKLGIWGQPPAVLYLQIWSGRVQLALPLTDGIVEEKWRQGDVKNPFAHPRMLISDFELAVSALKGIIEKAGPLPKLKRPVILFHLMEKHEGGVSAIEERVFSELAQALGARAGYPYVGPVIGPQDAQDVVSELESSS